MGKSVVNNFDISLIAAYAYEKNRVHRVAERAFSGRAGTLGLSDDDAEVGDIRSIPCADLLKLFQVVLGEDLVREIA